MFRKVSDTRWDERVTKRKRWVIYRFGQKSCKDPSARKIDEIINKRGDQVPSSITIPISKIHSVRKTATPENSMKIKRKPEKNI